MNPSLLAATHITHMYTAEDQIWHLIIHQACLLTWLFIRKLHDGPAFKPAGKSLEKAAVIEQQLPVLPQKPADIVHQQRGIFTNPAKKVMPAADHLA